MLICVEEYTTRGRLGFGLDLGLETGIGRFLRSGTREPLRHESAGREKRTTSGMQRDLERRWPPYELFRGRVAPRDFGGKRDHRGRHDPEENSASMYMHIEHGLRSLCTHCWYTAQVQCI